MDYIIKVKHNRYPGDFQVFCRITDNKNHEEVIGEMCNVLTLSEFCDCTFVYEEAPSQIALEKVWGVVKEYFEQDMPGDEYYLMEQIKKVI